MLIPILQIAVSVILIVLILLQQRSAGLGGLLGGGGGEGGFYQARRGFENIIFRSTIILAVIFAGLAVAQLIVR